MHQKSNLRSTIGILFITVLFIFSLTGCSSVDCKAKIFSLIADHKEVFLADIRDGDYTASLKIDMIEDVHPAAGCINFYCGGYSISVSSHEFGFYYSFNDKPSGVWENTVFCGYEKTEPDGKGFSADFQRNCYYTEKICDHFYYYELHF